MKKKKKKNSFPHQYFFSPKRPLKMETQTALTFLSRVVINKSEINKKQIHYLVLVVLVVLHHPSYAIMSGCSSLGL